MNPDSAISATNSDTTTSSATRLIHIVLWFSTTLVLAVAVARLAVRLQMSGFATLFVLPAVGGTILALGACFLAAPFRLTSRPGILAGLLVAILVLAVAEHGFFYLEYRHQFEAKLQSNPQVALLAANSADAPRPAAFLEFMSAEAPAKWPLWTADTATMITVAMLTAWWMTANGLRTASG